MDNIDQFVTELQNVTSISAQLLQNSEPMLSLEKYETALLRDELIGLQRDTALINSLLQSTDRSKNTFLSTLEHAGCNPVEFGEALLGINKRLRECPSFEAIAKELQATPRPKHITIIPQISEISDGIRQSRRLLATSFKGLWLAYKLADNQIKLPLASNSSESSIQLQNLLSTFAARPFSVGASMDPFVSLLPQSRSQLLHLDECQHSILEIGRAWFTHRRRDDHSISRLAQIRNEVVELLWTGGIEALHAINVDAFHQERIINFSDLKLESGGFSDHIRDSLMRQLHPRYSTVFVGLESAGKSSFLNAMVGIDVLPVGSTSTTAYPCRIQHVPGVTIPELRLGTNYLNTRLELIRKQSWYARITALRNRRWKGEGLPPGIDFEPLKEFWETAPELYRRLADITKDGFAFPEVVKGEEEIRNTVCPISNEANFLTRSAQLTDLNDLIHICQGLPMGFNKFEPEDWPRIQFQFPSLSNVHMTGTYEFVDIPGVKSGNTGYLWNEMIRQTIREATTLVVIVSHNSFHTSRWYELPRIISTESSVRVAAVVLTMRDTGTITTREVTERKKLVRSVFWPDATNAGLVFSCSSTVGPVLEEIDDFLGKSSVPPPWEYYWESSRRRASRELFGDQIFDHYDKKSIQEIREISQVAINSVGFRHTRDGLVQLTVTAQRHSLADDIQGLEEASKSVTFDLRRMLAAVGRATGDITIPETFEARRASDDAMELLDLWKGYAMSFKDDLETLLGLSSGPFKLGMETCVEESLHQAIKELEAVSQLDTLQFKIDEDNKTLEFRRPEDIQRYMKIYENIFQRLSASLEASTSREILEGTENSRKEWFRNTPSELEDGNPPSLVEKLRKKWSERSEGDSVAAMQPLDPTPFIRESRIFYTPRSAFSLVEGHVLNLISAGNNPQQRMKNLHFSLRWLLAIASSIPFILCLPYWLRKPFITSYTLDMNALRASSSGMIEEFSTRFLRGIGGMIALEQQEAVDHAVANLESSFVVPTGYSPLTGLPGVTIQDVQRVIAAHTDLSAVQAVLSSISSMLIG